MLKGQSAAERKKIRKSEQEARPFIALLSAGITLAMATLVGASSSLQVEQLGPLAIPRTAHAATALADGRVLITGGRDAAGTILSAAEVFDPSQQTSTAIAPLARARTNHTATLLHDGRVLIAGGSDASGPLTSAEIFDPSLPSPGFRLLSPQMSAARSRHTATLLNNGKVLIAGGDDAGTAEIFDPATETFSSSLLAMTMPRSGHTATLFTDDSVLLAGGNTASMELFTPSDQKFTLETATMSAARTGHWALELSNTSLLLFEGDTGNTIDEFNPSTDALTSKGNLDVAATSATALVNGKVLVLGTNVAGLYAPDAVPPTPPFIAFDETSVPGSTALQRSGLSATQLSGDKKIFVAGGVNAQNLFMGGAALFNPARIWTDMDDYSPGDDVILSGSGWKPNENVYLYAVDDTTEAWTYGSTVTADASGGFVVDPYFVVQLVQLGANFHVTAVGAQSNMQADVKFTDNSSQITKIAFDRTGPADFTSGAANGILGVQTRNSLNTSEALNGNAANNFVTISITSSSGTGTFALTSGGPFSAGPLVQTINSGSATNPNFPDFYYKDTATGSVTLTATVTSKGSNLTNLVAPGTTATITKLLKTAATVTLGNLSQTYDGTPMSATATTNPAGLTVTFTYNGSPTAPTNAGSYTVVGTINDATYTGSATGTLVISKATPTVTVTGGTFTYNGNQHAATATAVGVDGITPVSGSFVFTYTPPGNSTAPTNASATPYAVSAAFTSTNSNYSNSSGSGSITINKATPTFSSLTGNQTITQGTASISVSGRLNAGAGVVPSGTGTVTVSPASANTSVFTGSPGNFSATVNTSAITAGTYNIVYNYAGDSNFFPATDSPPHTTLTVNSANVATTLVLNSVSPNSVPFGSAGPVTFTATLTRTTGGAAVSGATVNFTVVGGAGASAVTDGSGMATFTTYNPSALSVGNHNVQASFTAATISSVSYLGSASGTLPLAVTKATPTINWSDPAYITYGTALSATQLNATATYPGAGGGAVTGTFTYTPDVGTVLNAGNNQELKVDFLPADAATYNSVTGTTVHINVNPKTLTAEIIGDPTRPYNGNMTATLTSTNFKLNGLVSPDDFTVTKTTGTYNSKDVATADTVTATLAAGDFTALGTTLATNYTLPTTASGAGHITPVSLTASIILDPTRPYNGNTAATLTSANFWLAPLVGSENFTVTQPVGTYNSKNVADADTVMASLAPANFTPTGGADPGNYTLPTTASGAGHITAVTLTASIIGNPTRPYNCGTAATLIPANFSLSGLVGTENFTVTQTAGTYNSKDVVSANTVNASLAAGDFTGTNGGIATNYVLPTSASGSGHITPVDALISVTAYTSPTTKYNCTFHMATGTATGCDGDLSALFDFSGTSHKDAGTYNGDAWSFNSGSTNPNYNSASGTVDDSIAKADATIHVTPYHVTYNCNAHTATGTATGLSCDGDLTSLLHLGGTTHTNANDYPSDPWTFDGNNNYNSASNTVHDIIDKADTTSSVTSNHNPSIIGQNVTFTATVAGNPAVTCNPTGTVTFKDGATTLMAGVSLSGGQTTFSTSSLTAGHHSITAVYSGDGNFNATGTGSSTAPSYDQWVKYTFIGFLQPIDNLPIVNSSKAGQVIPVKWQLKDVNGNIICDTSTLAPSGLQWQQIACDTHDPIDAIEELAAPGSTVFRCDGTQYIYNWQTSKSWAGKCVLMTVMLADGTMYSAQFTFK